MDVDLDDVDWAELHHAYGAAVDVPDLIRGLTSADPDERETAIDGLHATVHHQGDVYDSTLAALPFLLRIAADRAVADRARVVDLIAGVAGVDEAADPWGDDDDVDGLAGDAVELYRSAHDAVLAELDVFVTLLADDDPAVRAAAARLVAAVHPDRVVAVGLLRRCAAVEQNPEAHVALVQAATAAAKVDPGAASAATPWHRGLVATGTDPVVRLAALGALAGYAPRDLPEPVVATAIGLLALVRADPDLRNDGTRDERPATPTLSGAIRSTVARDTAGGLPEWVLRTVFDLHRALGDRVEDRTALVLDGLASPDRSERLDAVRRASVLVSGWRGRFQPVVRRVAALLRSGDERIEDVCGHTLGQWHPLTVVVVDDLAAHLAVDPGHGVREWATGPPGLSDTAMALARLGDRRAVGAVRELLGREHATADLGWAFAALGHAAAPLGGDVLRRCADLASQSRVDPTDAESLLRAAGALRLSGAADAVVTLLRRGVLGRPWLQEAAVAALGAMGRTVAGVAAPVLAELASSADDGVAVRAAEAHWQVTGSDGVAVPTFVGRLAGSSARPALAALGSLGTVPAGTVERVRDLLDHDDGLVRIAAGVASARLTSRDPAVLDRLTATVASAWIDRPLARPFVADALVVLSPPAEMLPLLAAEVANPRRHGNDGGLVGSVNTDVRADEHLLEQCRTLLATR